MRVQTSKINVIQGKINNYFNNWSIHKKLNSHKSNKLKVNKKVIIYVIALKVKKKKIKTMKTIIQLGKYLYT